MPRQERAKQFAPFDALKGLNEALRLKEYENEKITKGDLSEDSILEISKVLGSLKKFDKVYVKYFYDGHEWEIQGESEINFFNQEIKVNQALICFDSILEIRKIVGLLG